METLDGFSQKRKHRRHARLFLITAIDSVSKRSTARREIRCIFHLL